MNYMEEDDKLDIQMKPVNVLVIKRDIQVTDQKNYLDKLLSWIYNTGLLMFGRIL